jgi:MoCo/4Fe-4S cofactor protein with predicted Tat translocation signal
MENTTKRYWRGLEELRNDPEFVKNSHREFADASDITDGGGTYRRDFLKMLGFGVAAVSLAACEAPVKKVIPYLNKPVDVEPGVANYYASSFVDGGEYCSVLVKTREGRPIFIEGNPLSGISQGGVGTRVHASVLSLYDNEKLKEPQKGGKKTEWETLDKEVAAALAKSQNIRLVTGTVLSPTTKAVIEAFKAKYPSTVHVSYDPASAYGLTQVHGGQLPAFDFSKAKVIVSLDADFLGTWISPDEFAKQWAAGRKVSSGKGGNRQMSRHYDFSSIMSLTASNADYRGRLKPSQLGLVASTLLKLIGGSASTADVKVEFLEKAAKDLKAAAPGSTLVVSGSNDANVQAVVAEINKLLGNYGTTIAGTANYKQGNDDAFNTFATELKAGKVDAVIFYGANPVYNSPRGKEIAEALPNVKLSVSFADRAEETASLCQYIAPDSHFLESWGDAEPKPGYFSIIQPTISTIFNTRQAQSSLLIWAGQNGDFYEFLKKNWAATILKTNSKEAWNKAVYDGVFEPAKGTTPAAPSTTYDLLTALGKVSGTYRANSDKLEFIAYEKVGMGTGSQANNPWLQEFPDPISKACWDNYATLSQKTAEKLNVKQNDVVKLEIAGKEAIELPVLIQPGQVNDTVGVAIGYGRTKAGKAADGVGKNVFPWINATGADITVTPTGSTYKWGIAQTQTHNTVMARESVVQETVLAKYQENAQAGRFFPKVATSEGAKAPNDITLWNGHKKNNHSWGMVIDLNLCTGCGACVVACQSENNVPVVGRKEVVMRREMHWIRIDRYYSSVQPKEDESVFQELKTLELASENPEVVFQPMMCQHCSNAPCETVCPVLATTHSNEGLNQMTYNRCIGTRYCANNCPYKVRRFNWFKYFDEDQFPYHFNNDLGKMVINPEVTVRSRGVMEKCSFCVQRIQAGKLSAKRERRSLYANEVKAACSASCATGAIVFGDMNNPESDIFKILADEKEGRAFTMLEEINVLPQVNYLTKIRNKDEADAQAIHKGGHEKPKKEAHKHEKEHA